MGVPIKDPICQGSDLPAVVDFYSTDRKGDHPRAFLEGFNGVLQADGFTGFNAMYEPDPLNREVQVKEAGCWAHWRSKFGTGVLSGGCCRTQPIWGRAAFGKTKARAPLPRVRASRHSAEICKKGYSSVRTERREWIEIPVPAIVSEDLFLAVQEQLDENRKQARQRRRGAAFLLQGLTVCGHCQYAYYGKKVSKSAAKGGRQYAYYRCIGTDAYRFGGERICDNKQVRTERLDDLVWQQVVGLLSEPGRLKNEYERRLDLLERNERETFDTATLEKQKRHLEQSKSRLIDSYAEGVIDKGDFDPKIQHVKIRLKQIDHQIKETRRHQAGQFELFLIINRLEEFADAVNERLSTVDFTTKRDIIRALVNRIEIHKDEIIVVFRVDPDPGGHQDNENPGDTSISPQSGKKSLQQCKWSYDSPCGVPRELLLRPLIRRVPSLSRSSIGAFSHSLISHNTWLSTMRRATDLRRASCGIESK